MSTRLLKLLLIPTVVALGLLVSACGKSDDEGLTGTDAAFAAQMLPHHERAIEMADLALETTSEPGISQLAQGIVETQETEIETLESLIDRFGVAAEDPSPEVSTLNEGVISELESASGREFDEIFLKEMSARHSAAIDMSGLEIAGGSDDETVELAEEIRSTQIEEIGVMQELLGVEAATEHGSDSGGLGTE